MVKKKKRFLALSVRQPWANLIMSGFKDIEIRSWKTTHRGLLLIHAGVNRDRPALSRFKGESDPTGVLLGSVSLVNIFRFTPGNWESLKERTLEEGELPQDQIYYGWVMAHARLLPRPIPFKGIQKLFAVEPKIELLLSLPNF